MVWQTISHSEIVEAIHHYTIHPRTGVELKHGAVCPICGEGKLWSCMCELCCQNKECDAHFDNHYEIEYRCKEGEVFYCVGHA